MTSNVHAKEPSTGPATPPSLATDRPFSRQELWLLMLITVLAAALRLYKLGEWSLWVDEGHTYRDFMAPADSFLKGNIRSYPLSYLLMRWLEPLLPSLHEAWLRLPFAFFGIISVPTLALLGRMMVGRSASLTGALLLAVSPWHIYWSQNCRSYALLLFFVILAAAAWWQAVYRRNALGYLGALVGAGLAGLSHWSGHFMLGVFALHWMTVFWLRGREDMTRLERWMPVGVVVVLGALSPILVPMAGNAIEYAARAHGRDSAVDLVVHMSQTTLYFVRLPLAIAAFGGLLWLRDRVRHVQDFLIYWAIAPFVLVTGASVTMGIVVTAQYAIALLPACCLLAGVCVAALREHLRAPGLRGRALRLVPVALIALDMVGYDFLYFTKQHGDRPRWKEAAAFVQADRGERKLIFTTNEPSLRYYFGVDIVKSSVPSRQDVIVSGLEPWQRIRSPLTEKPLGQNGEPVRGDAFLIRMIAEANELGYKVYVVVTKPELEEMDDKNAIIPFLMAEMPVPKELECWTGPKDMIVKVFKAEPPK